MALWLVAPRVCGGGGWVGAGVAGPGVVRGEGDGLLDAALPGGGSFRARYPFQDQLPGGWREAGEVRLGGVIVIELCLQVAGMVRRCWPAAAARCLRPWPGRWRPGRARSSARVRSSWPRAAGYPAPPAARRARGEPERRAARAAAAVEAVDPPGAQRLLDGLVVAQARGAAVPVVQDQPCFGGGLPVAGRPVCRSRALPAVTTVISPVTSACPARGEDVQVVLVVHHAEKVAERVGDRCGDESGSALGRLFARGRPQFQQPPELAGTSSACQ